MNIPKLQQQLQQFLDANPLPYGGFEEAIMMNEIKQCNEACLSFMENFQLDKITNPPVDNDEAEAKAKGVDKDSLKSSKKTKAFKQVEEAAAKLMAQQSQNDLDEQDPITVSKAKLIKSLIDSLIADDPVNAEYIKDYTAWVIDNKDLWNKWKD